jgi:hypothetical protein
METNQSLSLVEKLKIHGKFLKFDSKKGYIYSMNDCLYAFSRNGIQKI